LSRTGPIVQRVKRQKSKDAERGEEVPLASGGFDYRLTQYAFKSNDADFDENPNDGGLHDEKRVTKAEDFRQTYKKVPKISGKYPAAFGEVLPKPSKLHPSKR
jgi:hypothetical protein